MYNILVCDDEKDIVSALTIYLTTSGYQVFPAYDGTEALALLEKEDIHLVLLDIMMPNMDGYEFTKTLRSANDAPAGRHCHHDPAAGEVQCAGDPAHRQV